MEKRREWREEEEKKKEERIKEFAKESGARRRRRGKRQTGSRKAELSKDEKESEIRRNSEILTAAGHKIR